MKQTRFPTLAYNFTTAVGLLLAGIGALTAIVLFVLVSTREHGNAYVGILLYLVIPAFMIMGLLLVPLGMWRRHRAIQQGRDRGESWPVVDLNRPPHRRALAIFAVGTVMFVGLSAFGAYHGYEYTESVEFCGTTCHDVMKPEYVAYQHSAHARVACASCHIGGGASWFAKSKISGMYQVYAVLADKYPRPIETPIRELRPAQETCEQCHWPQKFFGGQQKQFNHYMYDSTNTHWPINLLIKTGGGDPRTGQSSGIHWHMNIGAKVDYIARDHDRTDIPWVRVTDRQTGRVTVYANSDGDTLTAADHDTLTVRTMDCVDCHNRPSHGYPPPDETIDQAILLGQIDPSLPEIKRVAVEAMAETYETEPEALTAIANSIGEFYESNHPELYDSRRADIDDAILATRAAFSRSIFPEMKARWDVYPSNVGHFNSIGCMRCHNQNLQSAAGESITTDCNACHTILSQGTGARLASSHGAEGLEFEHPVDIDDAWRENGCYECHTGTQP